MQDQILSRRTILFVNIAHALDHFVLLIYPTAVLAIAAERGLDYGTLISLATGAFVAFGLCSLPMGWLSERFGRRNMLAVFFLGYGASCIGLSLAASSVAFAILLFTLGVFAAIYHPIGSAMLVTHARQLGRDLGWNGVWGNMGAALASGVTAGLAAWLGWRAAFVAPGVFCIAVGIAFLALVPGDGDVAAHQLRVVDFSVLSVLLHNPGATSRQLCQTLGVLPGEFFVYGEDILIMTTLGSCIAACLWDREKRIGGMNHFMLPDGAGTGDSGRYGSFAMELLINEMIKRGATRSTMEAKVFGGGAVISGMNSINVGERNTKFVLDYLHTERITVVSKDVMDIYPRKVCFLPGSGKAMVKRLASTNTEMLVAQEKAASRAAATPDRTGGGSVDLF